MEHKIYDIFPTPVIKFNFDREFNQSEINFIKKCENTSHKNFGNKSSNDTYVLKNNELKEVSDFCENALKHFFHLLYNPISEVEIYITQSWLNWTYKNEYHHTHSHPNSVISGVFYVSANKKFDTITFGRSTYKTIDMYPKALNDYNTDEVDFKVGTGELLLFPSHLQHRVNVTKGDDVRISLAFNSFVKGELGHIQALNYLKL